MQPPDYEKPCLVLCHDLGVAQRSGWEASYGLLPVAYPGFVPDHKIFLTTTSRSGHILLSADLLLNLYFSHLPQQ